MPDVIRMPRPALSPLWLAEQAKIVSKRNGGQPIKIDVEHSLVVDAWARLRSTFRTDTRTWSLLSKRARTKIVRAYDEVVISDVESGET